MKILITGTSGFLASRVRAYLEEDAAIEVLAPSHAELDVISLDSCKAYFDRHRPDALIHLAAISDIAECARNEALSRDVNTGGPVRLATCAKEYGMTGRFLFASSDQVYSGTKDAGRLNRETDPLSPENLYAREKLEAEERVAAILPSACALRLDWMFDLKPGKANYLKNMIRSVREQRPVRYAVNELRAQTWAGEVAAGMKTLLFSDAPGGSYNFGGPASGNSYETAVRVYDLLGEALGMPVRGLAVPGELPVPRSLAMDQEKIRSVGIRFRDTADSAALCLEREAAYLDGIR